MAFDDQDSNSSVTTARSRQEKGRGLMERVFNRSTGLRRACLIGYWLGIFFMTHWPSVKDFPRPSWMFANFDLVVHFCMYAGWAALWAWVLIGEGKWAGSGTAKWVAVGGAAYSIFDEFTQLIVGRDAELGDFLADMLGAVIALVLVGRWLRRQATGRQRVAG